VAVVLGGAGGASVGLLPTIASGDSGASVTAQDDHFVSSGGGSTLMVAAGSTVSFAYPSGASEHDVHFTAMPSACTGSTAQLGPTAGAGAPSIAGPGWQGECTFNTPGTYSFFCDAHGSVSPQGQVSGMSGTIDVTAPGGGSTGSGSTPTTTTTTAPTATTTTTPAPATTTSSPTTTSPSSATAPATGSSVSARSAVLAALHGLSAARRQRGTRVSETFTSPLRGLRVVVELLGARQRVLGKLTKTTTGAGPLHLRVSLTASARSSLRRAGHLAVDVHTTVSGATLSASGADRPVTLRP
jgi:plastocyanin